MSRYLILFLLNLPLIFTGVLSAIVAFKVKTINRSQLWARLLLWLVILSGLASLKFIYDFLFSNNLTRTESLSLFDVMQITGVVFTLLLAIRAHTKVDLLQRQVHELHQQILLQLADQPGSKKRASRK